MAVGLPVGSVIFRLYTSNSKAEVWGFFWFVCGVLCVVCVFFFLKKKV